MNEHESPSSATAPPAPATEAQKPNRLRSILFAILAVMIVALIYEYGVARRSYGAAAAAIDDMVETQMEGLSEEPITPEQVREQFGKEPNGGLQDQDHYYVEHYQWRRWLPWKTLDIYVIYDHSDPPNLFNTTREPPGPGEVPMSVNPNRFEGPIAIPDMSAGRPEPRRGGRRTPRESDRPADDPPANDSTADGATATEDAATAQPADEQPTPKSEEEPTESDSASEKVLESDTNPEAENATADDS